MCGVRSRCAIGHFELDNLLQLSQQQHTHTHTKPVRSSINAFIVFICRCDATNREKSLYQQCNLRFDNILLVSWPESRQTMPTTEQKQYIPNMGGPLMNRDNLWSMVKNIANIGRPQSRARKRGAKKTLAKSFSATGKGFDFRPHRKNCNQKRYKPIRCIVHLDGRHEGAEKLCARIASPFAVSLTREW